MISSDECRFTFSLALDKPTTIAYVNMLAREVAKPRLHGVLVPYGESSFYYEKIHCDYPFGVSIEIGKSSLWIFKSDHKIIIDTTDILGYCDKYVFLSAFMDYDIDIKDDYVLLSIYDQEDDSCIGTFLCDFDAGRYYELDVMDDNLVRINMMWVYASFITYGGETRILVVADDKLLIYSLKLEYIGIFDNRISHTTGFIRNDIFNQLDMDMQVSADTELDNFYTYGYNYQIENIKKHSVVRYTYRLTRYVCVAFGSYDDYGNISNVMIFATNGDFITNIVLPAACSYNMRIIEYDRRIFICNMRSQPCYLIE